MTIRTLQHICLRLRSSQPACRSRGRPITERTCRRVVIYPSVRIVRTCSACSCSNVRSVRGLYRDPNERTFEHHEQACQRPMSSRTIDLLFRPSRASVMSPRRRSPMPACLVSAVHSSVRRPADPGSRASRAGHSTPCCGGRTSRLRARQRAIARPSARTSGCRGPIQADVSPRVAGGNCARRRYSHRLTF